MRKLFLLLCMVSITSLTYAAVDNNWHQRFNGQESVDQLPQAMLGLGLEQFLNLTPAKYKEMTGEKLSFGQTLQLKAAQKLVKKHTKGSADIPKGLYIVLAIFGWAWLAMGLMDDFEGNNWWMNLLLTLLCWLPGFIHALIKMKEYYK